MADRSYWEQQALSCLRPCDVIATNPPWVGWEYQSRSLRAHVQPGWEHYELYESGRTPKAFLKEDLSTLALVCVWDTLLARGGRSAAVLRTSTMTSSIASSGLRRLSLFPGREPLCLRRVDVLDELKVFPRASVDASAWVVRKGEPTTFPVPARVWERLESRWQPSPRASAAEVLDAVRRRPSAVSPTFAEEPSGRWTIGARRCIELSSRMVGECAYRGRTGVFTGGANAVYYLERDARVSETTSRFSNVVERSKRSAPRVSVELEDELVFEIVRGRDLRRWHLAGTGLLLCPHTAETRMDALDPPTMAARYPRALRYLESMRSVLDARAGFTRWEQSFRERAFYVLQRVGDYTFSTHKVCWKYIARDFITAVVGPDARGMPRLPNDKVMSIAVDSAEEAYYLCGLLSSSPVRWQVVSHSSGTQISVSSIESIRIPRFEPDDRVHARLAAVCRAAHEHQASGAGRSTESFIRELDGLCAEIFQWRAEDVEAFWRAPDPGGASSADASPSPRS